MKSLSLGSVFFSTAYYYRWNPIKTLANVLHSVETDKLPKNFFFPFIFTENGIIGKKVRVEMSSGMANWIFWSERCVLKSQAGWQTGCFGKNGQSPFPNVGQNFEWIPSIYKKRCRFLS